MPEKSTSAKEEGSSSGRSFVLEFRAPADGDPYRRLRALLKFA
jgi:hypothetical protein